MSDNAKIDAATTEPQTISSTIPQTTLETRTKSRRQKRDLSFLDSLPMRIFIVILSGGVFLGLWQLVYTITGNNVIVSSPYQVAKALAFLLRGGIPYGTVGHENIYTAVSNTAVLLVTGYAVSLVGIPIGILMGRWRAAETIIDPWINAIYSIPMVAIAPLIYALLFKSFQAAVLVVFLISVFTIIVNTYSGVKYTSHTLAEVGKTFGASEKQFFTKIIWPASLPDIVAGMRLGLGRAVLGAIVAQVLITQTDLGQLLVTFQELLDTPDQMAIIVLIAIIGIIALQTPRIIERYSFKWKETERMKRGFRR